MKAGARAVGVAESYRDDGARASGDEAAATARSTLAACVVRADRTVDGLAFGSCTVGGMDATDAVVDLLDALAREDVQYVLLAGVAPAWYNLLDLATIHEASSRPLLAVGFEASTGLAPALEAAFEGDALERRLERYRALPERIQSTVNGESVYLRAVGLAVDDAIDVVRAFTPEGGRPEPLRVARLAARAADRFRAD